MAIVKCKSHIEVYEHKARSLESHELSGRTGRHDLTRFVCESISPHLSLCPTDIFVDIGCGDGTLLNTVAGSVFEAIGVLPTNAEVVRVRQLLSRAHNVQIQRGLAQSTGLPAQFADKVVCNGVFILLADHEVDAALQEIARIAKPRSVTFIGEVPILNEFEGKTYGDSIGKWLWYVLRTQGIHAFLARLRQTVGAIFSAEPFLIAPKSHFFSSPERFIERGRSLGLVMKKYFRHREVTIRGEPRESQSRYDYVFERAES